MDELEHRLRLQFFQAVPEGPLPGWIEFREIAAERGNAEHVHREREKATFEIRSVLSHAVQSTIPACEIA